MKIVGLRRMAVAARASGDGAARHVFGGGEQRHGSVPDARIEEDVGDVDHRFTSTLAAANTMIRPCTIG